MFKNPSNKIRGWVACLLACLTLPVLVQCERDQKQADDLAPQPSEPQVAQSPRADNEVVQWDDAEAALYEKVTSEVLESDQETETIAGIIESNVDAYEGGSERSKVARNAILRLPIEFYREKWDLLHDPRFFSVAAIPSINWVIRSSFEIDPAWAIEKTRSQRDISMADSGVQSYVRHFRKIDTTDAFRQRLDRDFGDTDLYSRGVDYWIADLPPESLVKDLDSLAEWTKDPRIDDDMRGFINRKLKNYSNSSE